mgnify:CR=1 FL=1
MVPHKVNLREECVINISLQWIQWWTFNEWYFSDTSILIFFLLNKYLFTGVIRPSQRVLKWDSWRRLASEPRSSTSPSLVFSGGKQFRYFNFIQLKKIFRCSSRISGVLRCKWSELYDNDRGWYNALVTRMIYRACSCLFRITAQSPPRIS